MSATPPKRLTDAAFADAAAALGVDDAAIRAVAQVESIGRGFLPTGEPVILFERHVFSWLTQGRFDKDYSDVSNRVPGGYGTKSEQHERLQRAGALDRDAALQSASWGLFQVMGFNYRQCGFSRLQGFINAMYAGEPEQLAATIRFIRANPKMHAALQARDWARFAAAYNGPAYKKNAYDKKLAAAYKQHGGRV